MGSLNKVMLIGNLGRDPEIRYTQAGSPVANFPLATNSQWTDRHGQRQERTEWHDIVVFDRLADQAQNYLKKGSSVFIEGRLQTRSWEDSQGQKRYRTEVVATVLEFLHTKTSGEESRSQTFEMDQQQSHPQKERQETETPPPQANQNEKNENEKEEFIKDDIPF